MFGLRGNGRGGYQVRFFCVQTYISARRDTFLEQCVNSPFLRFNVNGLHAIHCRE